MKSTTILLTLFAIVTMLVFNQCKKDKAPVCEITNPVSGAEIEIGEQIVLSVDAEDDGQITDVKFYIDGIGVGIATEFPYNYDWETSEIDAGSYTIRAKATDDTGNSTEDEINIELVVICKVPEVETNPAADITANSVTLNGEVTSDGGASITQRGFYWSATKNTPDSGDNIEIVDGNPGAFSFSLSGLNDDTSYYYAAFATNSEGTNTGNPVAFKTNKDTGGEIVKGEFTDSRDNHTYKTVKIGSQTWMAENLAYLPSISPSSNGSNSQPYYYVFGYEGSSVGEAKATSNYENCGVMYNWTAAMEGCPSGWHLPTDDEWKQLEMAIGMSKSEADDSGWRGTDEGKKLKAINGWFSEGNGTDEYGFGALPGGSRGWDGSFHLFGGLGFWWTATTYESTNAWRRNLSYNSSAVERDHGNREDGYYVRCVRD